MDNIQNRILKILLYIGIIEIIVSIIINPKIQLINIFNNNYKNDVLKSFSITLFIIGIGSLILYMFIKNKHINIILLYMSISLIVVTDHILLVKYGLPLWKYDKELHYVHRNNKESVWSNGKIIKINSLGFHDVEVNVKKKNEYRLLNIGDSIVMGHEVDRDETFSFHLKNRIFNDNIVINSINLGVQGYSTFQYYLSLRNNLYLNPDHVTISICLNDFIEQYVVNKKYGGSGFDYHQVLQTSNEFWAYLLNDTGFGRLIQKYKYQHLIKERVREKEINEVHNFTMNSENEYEVEWDNFFEDIDNIIDLALKYNFKLTILIFPYTFQLYYKDLLKPQSLIKSYLDKKNISYIDVIEEYQDYININNMQKDYFISKYYIDENHLSVEGHKLLSEILYNKVFN